MEKADTLKLEDKVRVLIFGPEGNELSDFEGSGFHSLDVAIESALSRANIGINPEDCVFRVTNETTGVSHRYRFNAHGHLKLLPEN